MPRTFKRVHACSTNDHGADNDNIKGWIEHAGGTYTTCIMPDTTHLLCSKSAWKRYSPLVKEARRTKKIKIVKLDWLIMSLTKHSNKAKNRPLPTTEWEWTQRKLVKSEQDQKSSSDGGGNGSRDSSSSPHFRRVMELEKMGRTFTHALQRLETKMSEAGYALFTDALGFKYSLALLRKDTHSALAQYNLYISDETKPCFALASITVDGRGCAVTQDIIPMRSGEGLALEMWRRVFAGRTGRVWDVARCGDGKGVGRKGEWVWDGKEVVWRLGDGAGGGDGDGEDDDVSQSGCDGDADADGRKACSMSSPTTTTTSAVPTKNTHTHTTPTPPVSNAANPPPRSPIPTALTVKPPAQIPTKDASKRTLTGKIRKTQIAKTAVNGDRTTKAKDRAGAKGVSKAHVERKGEGGFLARYLEGLK